MKSATSSSVRIEAGLLAEVERLLGEGESSSEFVVAAVRAAVCQREQAGFAARGLHSLARAKQNGSYAEADEVLRKLEDKLSAAKAGKPVARS